MLNFITIEMPKILRVSDYHELELIKDTINELKPSTKVKVKEVGFDGEYIGLLYTGNFNNHRGFVADTKKREGWGTL